MKLNLTEYVLAKLSTAFLASMLTLISITSASAQIITVVNFDGTNGANPVAGLTLGDNNTLYGTTSEGGPTGATGGGTVFSLSLNSASLTSLANFNIPNGYLSLGGVILSGSKLYGTTQEGGTIGDSGLHAYGTVFSIPITGGNPTTLGTFDGYYYGGQVDGALGGFPDGKLTLVGNSLYGTTQTGGTNIFSEGTVFSLPVTGGTPQTLASFDAVSLDNYPNGAYPSAGLTLIGGSFYTTTAGGGANDFGTVSSVPITGGTPVAVASFNGANGKTPWGNLTVNGSKLYGTTLYGGDFSYGTVFALDLNTGLLTTLVSFNGANGSYPYAGLTLKGNTLYGTTQYGGLNGDGTVFALNLNTDLLTTLASFEGANGSDPASDLTLVGNTLYGTTTEGGTYGDGTVFGLDIGAQSTPEPSTFVMLLMGLSLLAFSRMFRKVISEK